MRKSKEELRSAQQRELSVGMKRLLAGYRALLESELEKENITLAQLRMLKALYEQQDASAAELARICYITPQSMQAVVTRAEREGWITRSTSAANRRVLTATLTKRGQQVLERGLALASSLETHLWGSATSSELHAFNATLGKVLMILQQSLDARHEEQTLQQPKKA